MSLCWRKLCTGWTGPLQGQQGLAVSGDEDTSCEHQHSCLYHPRGDDVQWLILGQINSSNHCSCIFLAAVWACFQANLAVLSLLVGVAHGAELPLQPGPGEGRILPEELRENSAATLAPPASSTSASSNFCCSKQPILSNCSEPEQLSRNFVHSIFSFQ